MATSKTSETVKATKTAKATKTKPKAAKPKAAKPKAAKTKTTKAKPKKQAAVKTKRYVCTRVNLYHPFQRVMVGPHPGVHLELDSWLESQIERGLIKEV